MIQWNDIERRSILSIVSHSFKLYVKKNLILPLCIQNHTVQIEHHAIHPKIDPYAIDIISLLFLMTYFVTHRHHSCLNIDSNKILKQNGIVQHILCSMTHIGTIDYQQLKGIVLPRCRMMEHNTFCCLCFRIQT